ncbi:YkgJ family cysteine cluster protein [Candidatus Bathyarchaeota archaeon]|nr:YkgJ family cysteine cluster protein [Candidatus Bathyarchaeota archaeon]
MDFIYPEKLTFVCAKCGICCGDVDKKKRHILMLKEEAKQISIMAGKNVLNFANINVNQTPYDYEMKKNEKGNCIFLNENKCDIYSIRPLICRFYPFELINNINGDYEFLFTKECPGLSKGEQIEKDYFEKLFLLACSKFNMK